MSDNKSPFVHLHVHSDYSLLTGLSRCKDIVNKVAKDGMEAVALTDLGNLYGVVEFFQECKKNNIKPIIGAELYIAPNGHKNKRPNIDEERHSLVVLAENNEGYSNLLKIISIGFLDGFYYKPRVDLDVLRKYSSGLIALSGALQGEVPKAILKNFSQEKLDGVVDNYLSIFGEGNFFIEIVRHPNIPEQEIVNQKLIELAKRKSLPLVAGQNSFYTNTEDDQAHDILLCIQNNRKVFEENRFTMMGEDYSILSTKEMLRRFDDLPEAIENTKKISDRCNVNLEFGVNKLPSFVVPDGYNYETYLRYQCYKGLEKRYGGVVNFDNYSWDIDPNIVLIEYKNNQYNKQNIIERLEYELSVIEKTGYASYFLIVSDFIKWAKGSGIFVGPGRGSAAGSMVAYLTEICSLDPIKYELLFERFLNPERVSMPDIDTDFADARRGEVIRYVQEKYGFDHVSGIITFGTLGAKAVVRDTGRALGIEYGYCDKISKMIPTFSSLSEALENVPDLKKEYKENPDCKSIIDNALKLEGAKRHASQHACGILITKDPLTEYVPVQKLSGDEESIVSQYSLHPIEDLGLLKMDFLGLKNLTIMEHALETIEKIHDVRIDLEKISFDDPKTFALLQRGETTGVFQFESGGMKRYMKQLKPTELEDLIAMGALYRPGPLDAGMVEEYIQRKNGIKEVTYIHPLLEPILRDTFGVIVYQEQVMRIARDMAGFTMGQADTLRKAVGKKIKELMDKQQDLLLKGMDAKGIPRKVSMEIWGQIETFARYGFNRSHAACYGVISYYTAFLKANYPSEYLAALLTADLDDIDRLAIEINECRQNGIEVMLPDVNESFTRFTVVAESLAEGKPRIRFGLSGIKGVGDNIAKTIIRERRENGQFKGLEDFLLRVHSKNLNKKSLDSLIRSGALDRFGNRNDMLQNMEKILHFVKENNQLQNNQQSTLFGSVGVSLKPVLNLEKYPPAEKKITLAWEKELLGFYLSEHPFQEYVSVLNDHVVNLQKFSKEKYKGHVRVAGLVTTVKKIITKKGEVMAFVLLEDTSGTVEVIVFPNTFAASAGVWQENTLVIVSGTVSDKDEVQKVICNEAKILNMQVAQSISRTLPKVGAPQRNNINDSFVIFFKNVVGAETINSLSEILSGKKGSQKVLMAVPIGDKKFRKIETNFKVDLDDDDLVGKISALPEVRFVKYMETEKTTNS